MARPAVTKAETDPVGPSAGHGKRPFCARADLLPRHVSPDQVGNGQTLVPKSGNVEADPAPADLGFLFRMPVGPTPGILDKVSLHEHIKSHTPFCRWS